MRRVRQLAASVLLVLMVPSLALAAMPMRYCIGPSGHQAIEFVLEGLAHGGSDVSHEQEAQKSERCAGAVVFADAQKCTDKALMDTASAPPSVDLRLLPLSSLLADSFALPPQIERPSVPQIAVSTDPGRLKADPRMEVRRTVVLLI